MLVLSRRLNQKIVFPGTRTTVQVVSMKSGVVRLGIAAPEHVAVYREELLERKDFQGATAVAEPPLAEDAAREMRHLLNNRLNASTIGLALLRRQLELGLTQDMAATLDKIEDNLKALQQRVERIGEDRPRPAKPTPRLGGRVMA